jgi:hypothetical protein
MSDVQIKFEGSTFTAGLDSDGDGVKSISFKLHLSEALEEAVSKFKKGDEVEPVEVDVKALRLDFDGGLMKLVVDTDKDGEALLEVEANLLEAVDEGMKKFRD